MWRGRRPEPRFTPYVRFEDNALVSLPPHLLRRLPDAPNER
ncbi:MAG: hypothetical protein WBV74_20340 [Pseudonocardiaceae bacterium]